MNIIVLIIDTLRHDHIGANGNDWIHTPNMDRLARESWRFDRCYTASYPTIPHRADVITGSSGGPFHPWAPLPFDVLTFPEVLAEAGYCTQLIHDTPHLVNGGHNFDWPFHAWTFVRGAEADRPWIDSLTGYPANWGHDPLFDFVDQLEDTKVVATRRSVARTYVRANRKRRKDSQWNCPKLFRAASQWLRDNATRNNFLLWVDCFDPHEPWDVPREFATMYDKTPGYDGRIDPRCCLPFDGKKAPKAAADRIRALYAAKVTWMDKWLGEFLNVLDDTGLSKSTALLMTADHGTNLGERSVFHKAYPVREQEAHVPLFIRLPEPETRHSDMIVQPQDIFATVMGLAGLPVPDGLDSQDVMAAARGGGRGKREVALAGVSADKWAGGRESEKIIFTVFGDEWYLEFAAKPERCRLTRYGSLEDVASTHEGIVQRLRAGGVDEIERRGADPALVAWLRTNGESEFPAECRFWDGWPGPAGYTGYFNRLYDGP